MRGWLESLLLEWGDFNIRFMEYADEYGENTLHRCGLLMGRVQESPERDKVLCPDMPTYLQKIDIAVNTLPLAQKTTIRAWYAAPRKADGTEYTELQIAVKLNTSVMFFRRDLHRARNKLRKLLK